MVEEKLKRGRPKALSREHVVRVAMFKYWEDGPTDVPIAEIAEAAETSKPALYREFGSDDGLKSAVLQEYHAFATQGLFETLAPDKDFLEIVGDIVDLLVPLEESSTLPAGCLFITMRSRIERLGPLTQEKIHQYRGEVLANYRAWIVRAQRNGTCRMDLSADFLTRYCDQQISGAMLMQREGVPNAEIAKVLLTAFASLAVSE